jgi:DNA-binding SARP family transcriptional activator
LLPYQQITLTCDAEAGPLLALLERGIQYIRQGQYAEGIAFITFVRERLSPDQVYFAARLDALIQSHEGYLQAVQTLQLASKGFVKAEGEQEAQVTLLEKLLPTLHRNMDEPVAGQADEATGHESLPADAANGKCQADLQQFSPGEGAVLSALYITCFGCFEVRRSNQLIVLCRNRCGQVILRYLATQPGYRASRDMLMEVFWHDDEPSTARHKLEVAVSALRRSLNHGYACNPGGGYIVCKGQVYQLNPAVTIHSDVDDFLSLWRAGRRSSESERAALYEKACALRNGPFLVEDMYADWSFMRREQLNQAYLSMCHALADYYLQTGYYENAAKWASARLSENSCDEVAHQQLMRVFAAEGRRSEAIRQYQRCERMLMEELGMPPMRETTRLFHALLAGEHLLPGKESDEAGIEQG